MIHPELEHLSRVLQTIVEINPANEPPEWSAGVILASVSTARLNAYLEKVRPALMDHIGWWITEQPSKEESSPYSHKLAAAMKALDKNLLSTLKQADMFYPSDIHPNLNNPSSSIGMYLYKENYPGRPTWCYDQASSNLHFEWSESNQPAYIQAVDIFLKELQGSVPLPMWGDWNEMVTIYRQTKRIPPQPPKELEYYEEGGVINGELYLPLPTKVPFLQVNYSFKAFGEERVAPAPYRISLSALKLHPDYLDPYKHTRDLS